ncbi:MAG: 2Fe-2S iron-sulfur cluster-binding protein [Bdellovibrionales bacterium]
MSNVKVTLEVSGESHEFEMSKSETVLEAALRNGVDAPYSCMAGVCVACQAETKSGKVSMESHDILSDDEVEEGQILCCQATPESDELHIAYPG